MSNAARPRRTASGLVVGPEPSGGIAGPEPGAARESWITSGTRLVHADLHNHTLLSDGDGDPELCFASLRAAGLDVAAITDHTTVSDPGIVPWGYHAVPGLVPDAWRRLGELADTHDVPGVFTALRGFEWSAPTLGHVNVWSTDHYTEVVDVDEMAALYRWLGERGEALAGFNHPGREPLRFEEFGYDAVAARNVVSLEMFNRRDDYLFEGFADGRPSPLVACLGAGWRTGLSGVTDEHGEDWGRPVGKGRTGLWVEEHSRRGVLDAMRARRFFATRMSGLRVDATALVEDDGTAGPVPMGGVLRLDRGRVSFAVDVDRSSDWAGRALLVQVLRPGEEVPAVAAVVETGSGEVTAFSVPLDRADGDWVVLRISDPTAANATPGPDGHPCNDLAVAYVSPWWLSSPQAALGDTAYPG